MLEQHAIVQPRARNTLAVALAHNSAEVREAQRLRYKVFAEEMGAHLVSAASGLDQDEFDSVCDHLIVRDTGTGEVVGTYRILPPERAAQIGGYYSEQEFDLTRLTYLRPGMVEIGRSCVHPDYRGGAVITLLWSGLADYLRQRDYDYLIGCASVSMSDGGHTAASLYKKLSGEVLSPVEWRVFPRTSLPLERLQQDLKVMTPSLIKGYLRVGAYICGEPAWDAEFNCADFMMLLSVKQMNEHYARHFMNKA
ncbi:MAG: GNAT family N-acetyltransferase [Sulfuriferula sp.]|nr:GNAT family N-acetyltransferase [Sulfuriferula sp.]